MFDPSEQDLFRRARRGGYFEGPRRTLAPNPVDLRPRTDKIQISVMTSPPLPPPLPPPSNALARVSLPGAIERRAPGERAREYSEGKGEKSEATKRAYAGDWKLFSGWMETYGFPTLPSPPGAVADYLAHLATEGSKASSIGRVISAVAYYHRKAGLEWFIPPEVRKVMKVIRKELKVAPAQKRAIVTSMLRSMLDAIAPGTFRSRDRALLLVGFFGAFRRSELSEMLVKNVEFTGKGLDIFVESSKTDQEGKGEHVGILSARDPEMCAVRALREHLNETGITEGPIFRNSFGRPLSPKDIAKVVQNTAKKAGLGENFGGHSLRAGHATAASQAGASEAAIMRQGRWKNVSVVRGYYRNATIFDDNSSGKLGGLREGPT